MKDIVKCLTVLFYIGLITVPIIYVFDDFKAPWNWIISIVFILAWTIWFLFMLVILGPALENVFPFSLPPIFNMTNRIANSTPKLLSTNNESMNKNL